MLITIDKSLLKWCWQLRLRLKRSGKFPCWRGKKPNDWHIKAVPAELRRSFDLALLRGFVACESNLSIGKVICDGSAFGCGRPRAIVNLQAIIGADRGGLLGVAVEHALEHGKLPVRTKMQDDSG